MKTTWTVKKMKCDGCVKTIAEALLMVDGLSNVEVDLDSKSVSFDSNSKVDTEVAKKAMLKAGFPPEEK